MLLALSTANISIRPLCGGISSLHTRDLFRSVNLRGRSFERAEEIREDCLRGRVYGGVVLVVNVWCWWGEVEMEDATAKPCHATVGEPLYQKHALVSRFTES